jgi:hypothetical protein
MCVLDDRKRRTAPVVQLGVITLGVCLLGFAGLIQAGGQTATTQSHVVAVNSDPPGAMVWKKDGRDYTCTNTLTPGTVELTFHGDSDVQRLRVRRFGYSAKNLDVKPTDKEVGAVLLGQPDSGSFLIADDAAPDLKQLNATLKKEFEETLLTDQDAFRCAPFDLDYIHLDKDKEMEAVDLNVAIKLDRSFGGPAFRFASRAGNTPERRQRMGQAALEAGIAEILARFHRVAAKFPDLKVITVLCSYSTTEAVLDTETTSTYYSHTTETPIYYVWERTGTKYTTVSGWREDENTVVKDLAAEKTITFVVPAAQIPDTLDKKAITDAVLAVGKIITGK